MRMRRIRLTPAQREFLEIEIIEPLSYDDDESTREFALELEQTGLTLEVSLDDAEVLANEVLDVLNGIDDAIEEGETMNRYSLDGRGARSLHRSGSALHRKLLEVLRE